MPLQTYSCLNGHTTEKYLAVWQERGVRAVICAECHSDMSPIISLGRGLTYFEEGRARVIHNLGPEPVTITSHEQHKRILKERKLDWAPARRGMPGSWGG
jgi:hypothetical protein